LGDLLAVNRGLQRQIDERDIELRSLRRQVEKQAEDEQALLRRFHQLAGSNDAMSEVAMQANALRKLLEQKIESPDRGWPVKEAKLFFAPARQSASRMGLTGVCASAWFQDARIVFNRACTSCQRR